MKRWALFVLAAVTAALPLGAAQAEFELKPPGQGYRMTFPGKPRIRAEDVNTRFGPSGVVTAEWLRPQGGSCYFTHTRYLGGSVPEGPQVALDRVRFGRTVKGTMRVQKRFQFEGQLAQQDIVDTTFPGRPVIVSLDVVRGADVFSVYCIVDRRQEEAPDVQKFIGSFAFVP